MTTYTAIPGLVGKTGEQAYFRLRKETSQADLQAAWFKAGLAEGLLPLPTTKERALGRSVRTLADEDRAVVKPDTEGKKRKGVKGEGWLVVERDRHAETEDRPRVWHRELRVTMNGVGPKFEPSYHELRDEVTAEYERQLALLTAGDVREWVCTRLMSHLGAVAMRDPDDTTTRNLFFVPRQTAELWGQMRAVLKELGHTCYRIPIMTNDADTIAAISDAVAAEAEHTATELEAELCEGKLGERALVRRFTSCEHVEAKLGVYEELIGTKLDAVRERLERLRAAIAAATMKAAAGDQASP